LLNDKSAHHGTKKRKYQSTYDIQPFSFWIKSEQHKIAKKPKQEKTKRTCQREYSFPETYTLNITIFNIVVYSTIDKKVKYQKPQEKRLQIELHPIKLGINM